MGLCAPHHFLSVFLLSGCEILLDFDLHQKHGDFYTFDGPTIVIVSTSWEIVW